MVALFYVKKLDIHIFPLKTLCVYNRSQFSGATELFSYSLLVWIQEGFSS